MRNEISFRKESLLKRASNFCPARQILDIEEITSGNINKTFLVSVIGGEKKSFIMQYINTNVFKKPENLVNNLLSIGIHIQTKLNQLPLKIRNRRWEFAQILPNINTGESMLIEGFSYWRALTYIPSSVNLNVISSSNKAREVGLALGVFHFLTRDFPCNRLCEIISDFHVTPYYVSQFDKAFNSLNSQSFQINLAKNRMKVLNDIINRYREQDNILELAILRSELKYFPIHGDPKINNFMFDKDNERVVSLIDLDTLQPGILLYDIADCLRSCCNPAGEEPVDINLVNFDLKMCKAFLEGYCSIAKSFLSDFDFYYLPYSLRLITFELGLRFLTDHFNKNTYFNIKYAHHNLFRAEVQFKLLSSIEKQWSELSRLIYDLEKKL